MVARGSRRSVVEVVYGRLELVVLELGTLDLLAVLVSSVWRRRRRVVRNAGDWRARIHFLRVVDGRPFVHAQQPRKAVHYELPGQRGKPLVFGLLGVNTVIITIIFIIIIIIKMYKGPYIWDEPVHRREQKHTWNHKNNKYNYNIIVTNIYIKNTVFD